MCYLKPKRGQLGGAANLHGVLRETFQGSATEFDSTKPAKDDDVGAMLFNSVAGTTLTMKVDREGNISSVAGGEGLTALGQMTGAGGGGGGELFSSIFTPKKGGGQVAVGETWENVDVIDSPLTGRFRMVTRHTLTSVHAREATIDLRGKLEADSEAQTGSTFTIKNSGHQGSYLWDLSAGLLRRMESRMTSEIVSRATGQEVLTRSESHLLITREREGRRGRSEAP